MDNGGNITPAEIMAYKLLIDDVDVYSMDASVPLDSEFFKALNSILLFAPLFYEREEDWFYLAGVIVLKENGEMMDFTMDGMKVFSFPSTQAEVKLKKCPTSKRVFLLYCFLYFL